MGGNYEKGMYNQIMEVMARLDSVEKDYKKDVRRLNGRIDELTQENNALRRENQLLKDDNARLKSLKQGRGENKNTIHKYARQEESGHKMYCSIMTIIETLKKRNMGMIENIKKLFMGTPAIF